MTPATGHPAPFATRLAAAIRERGTPACIGLDPRHESLPPALGAAQIAATDTAALAAIFIDFCCDVIDAVAGLVPIVKLAGAASQKVSTLAELEAVAKKAVLQTRSVGVSMSPGSIPATGKPTFDIDEDKIGLGMGIHGEPGVGEIPMTSADELTGMMLDLIFADYEKDDEVAALAPGDEVLLLVNSLGATTMMELLIALRKAKAVLSERGIKIYDVLVGP